jgi:hypothetical protein
MTYKAFEVPEAGIEPALPQWKQDFKSLLICSEVILYE